MNIEQLGYVREVVECKSMSLAAQRLHISQSAISQSILLLEKELGIQLFKRSRLGTFPTDEGKHVIRKALEILKKVEEMNEEVQQITAVYRGELRIATISSLFMTYLPKALARFKKDFPQVNVSVAEAENMEIIDQVLQNEADVGLLAINELAGEKLPESLVFASVHDQGGLNVIVSKDSPLVLNQELRLRDILEYPLVLFSTSFWSQLTAEIEKSNGPLNVIFTTRNSEVVKRTVSEGLGIGLMSDLMLKDDPYVETGRIVPIPLVGYPLFSNSSFGGIYAKGRNGAGLAGKFIEYILHGHEGFA